MEVKRTITLTRTLEINCCFHCSKCKYKQGEKESGWFCAAEGGVGWIKTDISSTIPDDCPMLKEEK